jgi:hypothetical protein
MLTEDCTRLGQLSQDVIDLRKYTSDLNKFRDRQNKIEELVGSLRPLVIALKTFRERKSIDVDFSQKANALLVEVTNTLSEFQKDKGWLISEQFNFKSLQNKVTPLKSELETHLKQAWNKYKEEKGKQVLKINDELLELFARIETFAPAVQTIKRGLAQLKTVDFPRDSQHFEQIDREIDRLTNTWNSLKSDEVPEAVLDFLRATATHGAPIELLTPEVSAWLKKQSITRFFHIRLSD